MENPAMNVAGLAEGCRRHDVVTAEDVFDEGFDVGEEAVSLGDGGEFILGEIRELRIRHGFLHD
jgi:hypothetical protein